MNIFLKKLLLIAVVGLWVSGCANEGLVTPTSSPSVSPLATATPRATVSPTLSSVTLEQLCYFGAYEILPKVALTDPEKFWKNYSASEKPGRVLYMLFCVVLSVEPVLDTAAKFQWHAGKLADGREYFVIEYPLPEPFSLTEEDLESGRLPPGTFLGVYYSAFVKDKLGFGLQCYALGQSLHPSGTSLRRCTAAGHYNLGEGPSADLPSFVASLDTAETRRVSGATILRPELSDVTDEKLRLGLVKVGDDMMVPAESADYAESLQSDSAAKK